MKTRITPYDYVNTKRFTDDYDKGIYLCTICGQQTTLKNSFSYRGFNLICNSCKYKVANAFELEPNDIMIKAQAVGERRAKFNREVTI